MQARGLNIFSMTGEMGAVAQNSHSKIHFFEHHIDIVGQNI